MTWAKDVWPSERARLMSGHMMPIEREAPTVATLDELESWFEADLVCEGARHPSGSFGHTVGAPAEYRVASPCCGRVVNQCASRVVAMMQFPMTMCTPEVGGCGAVFVTTDLKVVPI